MRTVAAILVDAAPTHKLKLPDAEAVGRDCRGTCAPSACETRMPGVEPTCHARRPSGFAPSSIAQVDGHENVIGVGAAPPSQDGN